MAYSKNTWSSGDTITAALLNNLETQYEEVEADFLPWVIDLDVFGRATNTNWDTLTVNTGLIHTGHRTSSGAQNDEVSWPIILGAGTWDIELTHFRGSDCGIYHVYIDAIQKTTIDGYDGGGATSNFRSNLIGMNVATSGKVTLKLKMETKNAGSSSYYSTFPSVL